MVIGYYCDFSTRMRAGFCLALKLLQAKGKSTEIVLVTEAVFNHHKAFGHGVVRSWQNDETTKWRNFVSNDQLANVFYLFTTEMHFGETGANESA